MEVSNREIAALVWLTIFVVSVLVRDRSGEIKRALVRLTKTFFVPRIMIVMLCAIFWIVLCILALNFLSFWRLENLKTTMMWAVSFAFVTLIDANRVTEEKTYFRSTIRDTVSVTVFITFIAELYSFSLPVELLLTPLLSLIGIVAVFSENKVEQTLVHRFSVSLSIIFGLLLVGHSVYEATGDLKGVANFDNLRDFCVPIMLSLAFLPYLYVVGVFMLYENTLISSAWAIKDKSLHRYALWHTVFSFRLNIEGLRRWKRDIGLFRPESRADIRQIITDIKARQRKEKYPPTISAELGWSPYQATAFLSGLGLPTDDYHPTGSGEWCAGSPMLKLDDSIFADNLAYYIEGDENAAKRLTLRLHVNDRTRSDTADARYAEACEALLVAAIRPSTSQKLVCERGQIDMVITGRRVRMQSEDCTNPEHGYTRTLHIDYKPAVR